MPKINYVTQDGRKHEVDVDAGYTVMEGAVNNDLDGLPAECGGACACATCHAYIDPQWLSKLPALDDMEDSMLDAAFDRRDNSRLTCQIEVTNELDGLVVHIAENEC
jgi:2Fe-2S ferredoxin|tara:strand:- start:1917 stop:2237 length:321 start_codon:yes stop_codon:yes gene_type:complete